MSRNIDSVPKQKAPAPAKPVGPRPRVNKPQPPAYTGGPKAKRYEGGPTGKTKPAVARARTRMKTIQATNARTAAAKPKDTTWDLEGNARRAIGNVEAGVRSALGGVTVKGRMPKELPGLFDPIKPKRNR